MALTVEQQKKFHTVAMAWLKDQVLAGNDRALYQLWKASAAQVKNAIQPYLDAEKTIATTAQAASVAAYAAQDAQLAATVTVIDAVTADPNP